MNTQQTEIHEACHAVAAHAVYVAVRWVDPEGECRCEPIYPDATLPGRWAAPAERGWWRRWFGGSRGGDER